jgi:hypothetical protein
MSTTRQHVPPYLFCQSREWSTTSSWDRYDHHLFLELWVSKKHSCFQRSVTYLVAIAMPELLDSSYSCCLLCPFGSETSFSYENWPWYSTTMVPNTRCSHPSWPSSYWSFAEALANWRHQSLPSWAYHLPFWRLSAGPYLMIRCLPVAFLDDSSKFNWVPKYCQLSTVPLFFAWHAENSANIWHCCCDRPDCCSASG